MVPKHLELLEVYRDDPIAFVEDVFAAKPTEQQMKVLEDLKNKHYHISVKSGHGTGKTCLEAWILIWFMLTRPHCRIPCTAPTQPQLFDVLWSEIAKWINKIKIKEYKECGDDWRAGSFRIARYVEKNIKE